MIKQLAAGVAGLALVGGAGSVAYNDNGDATVSITNPESGVVQSVTLRGGGGDYSCPDGTSDKVEPHDLRLGRIQLTIGHVRRQIRTIERRYPGNVAPPAVARRYNALADRDDRLVDAYNAEVDARNAIIDRDCTAR